MDQATFEQEVRSEIVAPALEAMRKARLAEELRSEIALVAEDMKHTTNRRYGAALWDKLVNLNVQLIKLERDDAGICSARTVYSDPDVLIYRGRCE